MARRSKLEIEIDEWNAEHFVCDECGISPEELYSFGDFGNNPLKIEDNGQYCKKHFIQKEKEYDKLYPEPTK